MKIFIMAMTIFFVSGTVFAGNGQIQADEPTLDLTKEQFENLDLIHKALADKDTNFKGFSGPKDKMRVHGISVEQAQKYIDKVDLEVEKGKDPKRLKMARILDNMRTVGLNDETIECLGIDPNGGA
jgi:hypothetical protein